MFTVDNRLLSKLRVAHSHDNRLYLFCTAINFSNSSIFQIIWSAEEKGIISKKRREMIVEGNI